MSMNRDAIHQHIDGHIHDHIEHVRAWVRQQSVSWDNLGVADCARLVAQSYRDLGCQEVEVIEGRFHPGVWAHYDAGSPVTIHSYCMFDTRTVTTRGWNYDPWGAELAPHGPYPRVLFGRGALGAKGPHVAFLNALSSIIAVEGTLPVNVMFLAEGEEIMGSPTYRQFVERYRHRLQDVNVSYCAASSQSPSGVVDLGLGLKGMIVLELTASGASWGLGPRATIHSSAASLVGSPPFRLAQALATLTEPDGAGCAVDGMADLWSYRKPLTVDEQSLLASIAEDARGRDWRNVLPVGGAANVNDLVGGLEGLDPLINFLYGPTFNIAGLRAGFLGPETATIPFIVPDRATAMLDMRMVVGASPDDIIELLRAHLDAHGFDDIGIEVFAAFAHAQTAPSDPAIGAVLDTLKAWDAKVQVWPIQAGGGPWTVVPNAFGVPCIRGGAIGGGGGGAHNEYLVIDGDGLVAGLADTEKFHVDLLYAYARSAGYEG
ncbi:MAG TPA: M20/M25/M40 family metallo-hydrolase [Thermomicrobiales bacterium]|nr:M20/M25/M40 family metallo-hydrolase [Thermomicrobiales bacterium]